MQIGNNHHLLRIKEKLCISCGYDSIVGTPGQPKKLGVFVLYKDLFSRTVTRKADALKQKQVTTKKK
jgi:hypothetical protein